MGRQSRRKRETRSQSVAVSKRSALYADYATNLSAYRQEFNNQFACPLCLRIFETDSLSRNQITLEHCIPGKLGGTQLTLTCKECNNTHGAKYDAHLVKWRDYEDHVNGLTRKPHRAEVIIGDARLNASITNTGTKGPIALEVVPGRVDPKELKKAEDFMAAHPDIGMSLEFQVRPDTDHRIFSIALLRSAYLIMFRAFAYGYLLHQPTDRIRKQIFNPTNEIIPFNSGPSVLNAHGLENEVLIVWHPQKLRCFFIPITLTTAYSTKTFGMILPGFNDDAESVYERWNAVKSVEELNAIKVAPIRMERRLLTEPLETGTPHAIFNFVIDYKNRPSE